MESYLQQGQWIRDQGMMTAEERSVFDKQDDHLLRACNLASEIEGIRG
jgi:hypothetical protein